MNPTTISDHFRFFLNIRPAISPDRLAKELAINRSNLQKIINGSRQIPKLRSYDFIYIMSRYGYAIVNEELSIL